MSNAVNLNPLTGSGYHSSSRPSSHDIVLNNLKANKDDPSSPSAKATNLVAANLNELLKNDLRATLNNQASAANKLMQNGGSGTVTMVSSLHTYNANDNEYHNKENGKIVVIFLKLTSIT